VGGNRTNGSGEIPDRFQGIGLDHQSLTSCQCSTAQRLFSGENRNDLRCMRRERGSVRIPAECHDAASPTTLLTNGQHVLATRERGDTRCGKNGRITKCHPYEPRPHLGNGRRHASIRTSRHRYLQRRSVQSGQEKGKSASKKDGSPAEPPPNQRIHDKGFRMEENDLSAGGRSGPLENCEKERSCVFRRDRRD